MKIDKHTIQIILVLAVLGILLSLGFWQLRRLEEKKWLISKMDQTLREVPVSIESLGQDKFYRKVKIEGCFLQGKDIYLYGRRSISVEKDGYFLVSPFKTYTNQIIMIVRGWFSSRYKKMIGNILADDTREIIGLTLPSEKSRLFVPNNDIKNNVWFTLELGQIPGALGLKVEDFYVVMDNTNTHQSDILRPVSINHLAYIRNNHLEYAITWFALAAGLLVTSVIYVYSRSK